MTKRLLDFMQRAKAEILAHWYWQALCCALAAAILFCAWLVTDGDTVAFVYSEF